MDYAIKIGGEAGQGIQTVGDTLARVFSRTGYYVFADQDYESRIRGGHNFYRIRFSDRPLSAPGDTLDIIVAFDKESVAFHEQELKENGFILYDSSAMKHSYQKPLFLDVPFESLALEHGGSKIMANTVAIGAVLGMFGMELEILRNLIRETFTAKGEDVIQSNMRSAMAGHDFTVKNCSSCSFALAPASDSKMLITGIEAIGLGAIVSGLKFYAAYPMTPSTGIMNYIAAKEKAFGIVVEQAEDEIAAINMALGASFAGVRAMTGTSGGGFALMVEGLSLAAMTETPVVIALGQRPGPATGLPTRTEQAELQFALYTAHGEFPRIIFAPGTPQEALMLTNKAFDLVEKYQVPAIIIFDQYLADSSWSYEHLDTDGIKTHDYRLRGDAFQSLIQYKRHAFTDSGVSPFGVPGDSGHVVVTDSDEHDEDGHIVEDAATRVKMMQKRLFKKLPSIRSEIRPPLLYGSKNPRIVIICWGSTYGVIREAVDTLAKESDIAMLHFSEIFPFPSLDTFDFLSLLQSTELSVCVENNATGQFARLLRAETGFAVHALINKYDGRPFSVREIVGGIREKSRRV